MSLFQSPLLRRFLTLSSGFLSAEIPLLMKKWKIGAFGKLLNGIEICMYKGSTLVEPKPRALEYYNQESSSDGY